MILLTVLVPSRFAKLGIFVSAYQLGAFPLGQARDFDSACRFGAFPRGQTRDFDFQSDTVVPHWDKTQLLREQTDYSVRPCLVSGENVTCQIPVKHYTVSDGDVKVCLPYDSV